DSAALEQVLAMRAQRVRDALNAHMLQSRRKPKTKEEAKQMLSQVFEQRAQNFKLAMESGKIGGTIIERRRGSIMPAGLGNPNDIVQQVVLGDDKMALEDWLIADVGNEDLWQQPSNEVDIPFSMVDNTASVIPAWSFTDEELNSTITHYT